MATASLFKRLMHDLPQEQREERIATHEWYAAWSGVADGKFTREQLENHFDIGTTGVDKNQLDWLWNSCQSAIANGLLAKLHWLNTLHAALMMGKTPVSNQQFIQNWLTESQEV